MDCLFPTLCESPHRTKMEVSVATMQKRLKEAFEVARRLTYEEATKQRRYFDRRAGAVTLQPGDVVMVCTDGFVGKRKVKDRWEDGDFIVESQLGDWPVYKVRCPSADDRQNPNTGFSIGTASCLLPMRTSMTPLAKHRLRRPQRSRMPPMRPCQLEWALKSPYLPW